MRIAYLLLHDFRFASYGFDEFAASRYHFSKEYARRMAAAGHDVKLYVLDAGSHARSSLKVDGYEIKSFRTSFRFPPVGGFGNDHNLEVLKELKRDAPEIVHFHNYYLWNFPYVALWVKRMKIPLVAQFHGTDPLHAIKATSNSPILRLCDRLLVPLRSEQGFLTERIGIPGERVAMFPSTGVETSVFHRLRPADGESTLLYAGRIPRPANYRWEKAPQHILPMVKALRGLGRKVRLIVAGDGPGLPSLKELAQRLGIAEAVEFLGQVDHERLPELYSRARLTFIPFMVGEVGPYWDGALQESLACGTPPIGFSDGDPGFRDLGLLVPTDPRVAAPLVARALEDGHWASSIDLRGPQEVREVSDWDVMSGKLESLYSKLARSQN